MEERKNGAAELHYYSDRLKDKLNQLSVSHTAIVEAPSGYGKTTAVRDHLAALPQNTGVYWFTAFGELAEACFWRFAAELANIDPNAGKRLQKVGLPNAATLGEACDALRSIRCQDEVFLVIDNFQYLAAEMHPALFTALVEHGGERLHVILLTQMMTKSLLAAVVGRGFAHITPENLRLDSADIRRYYADSGVNVAQATAEKVADFTGGWIIAVCLQLRAYREKGTFADTHDVMTLMGVLVWDKLSDQQQDFFLCLSPFEALTVPRMCTLMDWEALPGWALEALEIPFIYYAPEELQYWPHRILLDFVVLKCRERGDCYENACFTRAGDLYRALGDHAQALSFYWRVKDYDRILSLDLSRPLLESADAVSFSQMALDIAQNCPEDIQRRHLLSMLHIAWALMLFSKTIEFHALMEKLVGLLDMCDEDDADLLRGEWMLLSAYDRYPRLEEMTQAVVQAAELLDGTVSRVILPEAPWCFGAISQLDEFHLKKGEAEKEADALENCITVYSRLTGGHGRGADALFRAELAICRGDWTGAEIFAYKAAFVAESSRQGVIQLGAARVLAEVAMFRADADAWLAAMNFTERAIASAAQNTPVMRAALELARGLLYAELTLPEHVAPWLRDGNFFGKPLLTPMVGDAIYVHLSCLALEGKYTRLAGEALAVPEGLGGKSAFAWMLLSLLQAVGQYLAGNREQALTHLSRAAELELSEGFVTHLATWAAYLGGLADELIQAKYPDRYDAYLKTRERLAEGRKTISRALSKEEGPEALTEREREIALLAAKGLRNGEIAEKLRVSESTVRFHLRAAFQKLGVDRRSKLAEKLK
ncbi:MAG: ATP-dependent transcriptional regulator-like protein [Oscillospiraceae bacterium]|nr:ATP-dependent transcriptional regulator-like protein [Oscillospiraceae bacterium]